MEVPTHIGEQDAKAGSEWSEDEIQRIKAWWLERDQLKLIWHYAARYLGEGATREDVEDAVVEFYVLLEKARRSYRPGGPGFSTYLLNVCFKNHCVREGSKVRKRSREESSFDVTTQEGSTLTLEMEDPGAVGDPIRHAQSRALLAELSGMLNERWFPENQKRAFILRYFKGLSYEEIATDMKVPVGSVKGWLNRATCTARAFLRERGWSEW